MNRIHNKIEEQIGDKIQLHKAIEDKITENRIIKIIEIGNKEKVLVNIIKKEFEAYFENQVENIKAQNTQDDEGNKISEVDLQTAISEAKKADEESILKLLDQWLLENTDAIARVKPWTQAKSILQTAFEGYSYGSERGQIRNLSDHQYLVPLYDFGVGVYDFDLSTVRPMEKLAQVRAENAIKCAFENGEDCP